MAMELRTRTRHVDTLVSRISGIDKRGDIVKVYVYRKGETTRLSGPHGSRFVHVAGQDDVAGWKRAVSSSWGLTDVIAHAAEPRNGEQERMELRALAAKAKQLKQSLMNDAQVPQREFASQPRSSSSRTRPY
jgi:hypothetical protein